MRDGFGHFLNPEERFALNELERQQTASNNVTMDGTVVRSGSRFALRQSQGELYALESTGRAWPFEGEDVRVTGALDRATRLLHIYEIETLVA